MGGSAGPRDDLWTNLEHVSEWVRFADTKAGAILTVDGILATVLVTAFASEDLAHELGLAALLGLAAIFLLVSGAMCMLCLLPRLTIGHADNAVYFMGISNYSTAEDYFQAVQALVASADLDFELARETWSRSKAAKAKYTYVRLSLIALSAALLISAVIGVVEVAAA